MTEPTTDELIAELVKNHPIQIAVDKSVVYVKTFVNGQHVSVETTTVNRDSDASLTNHALSELLERVKKEVNDG